MECSNAVALIAAMVKALHLIQGGAKSRITDLFSALASQQE
jgi:hypothetical protein